MNGKQTIARSSTFIRPRKLATSTGTNNWWNYKGSPPTASSSAGQYSQNHRFAIMRASNRAADSAQSQRSRFKALARKWHSETLMSSSLTETFLHPAYQQIIGMGKPALPLIMEELTARPAWWFWAIDSIAGKSILPTDFQGDFDATVQKYLAWWKGQMRN
jgi:hypothetical protein